MLISQDFIKKRANIFSVSLLGLAILINPGEASTFIPESESSHSQAPVLTGAYYWQRGEVHQAIDAWKQEAQFYRLEKSYEKEAETILKISQGYINLGQFALAIFQLEKLLSSVKEGDSLLVARTWSKLGNAYSSSGALSEAVKAYEKSLEIEQSLSTLNNFVILLKKRNFQARLQADSSREGDETEKYRHQAKFYQAEAVKYAQLALAKSESEESLSSVRALIEWGKLSEKGLSEEQLKRGRKLLAVLLPSRTKVFLAINWAKLDSQQAEYWLSQAQEIAKTIEDLLAESYALLELGYLCERAGEYEQALKYALDAQLKAQLKLAFDSLYRSHWLAARIYSKLGKTEAAMANYRDAIAALDSLNQGLVTINVERRIDFQSEIEPIYRNLLELLLSSPNPSPSNLSEALLIFDKLRLAQLQNYFGDNCFEIETSSSSKELLADQNAVSLTSIILDKQTHLILMLPDGQLRYRQVEIVKDEIYTLASDWYRYLKKTRIYGWDFSLLGQSLYDLIVRPFEPEIAKFNPSTLIFIHDGILRNLPMAALFDGEKFLAQKWANVSSIGLNFKSTASSFNQAGALALGLGVARDEWSELENVEAEVAKVVQTLGGKQLLDREFTSNNLTLELNQQEYSVLHLATHGYFGGVAENSFILAYDKPLSAKDLEASLSYSQIPIDFLVLSACETAVSSELSALGLAGMALRSSINFVLGSFWQVQDEAQLELIEAFYSRIQEPTFDLASALQQVQIEQIEQGAHPYKWAALILIQN